MGITAASRALSWVAEQQVTHTIIVSDSMNMLQMIESGSMRVEWVESIRRSHLKKMTWVYTSRHAGVQGNERADFLANNAPTQAGRGMDRADIINAVRSQLCDMGRSTTLERVRELGVKFGHARQCCLRGRERRYSNQLLMGTVSRWTLEWLLQRRTEHEWECPMCHDVDCIT